MSALTTPPLSLTAAVTAKASTALPHEAGGAFFGRRTMSSVLYSSKFGTISVRPSLQIRYRSPEAGGKRVHCARTAVCQP